MSLNLEGVKCPVCHSYLFEDDDIVFCPECGAPHHRDCYKSIGHCALEEFHGTEKQYNRVNVKTDEGITSDKSELPEKIKVAYHTEGYGKNENSNTKCGMCGSEFDKDLNACPHCGAPNAEKLGGKYISIDLLGGVPADTDLGEGVTAEEAKRFVIANTQRYIPKFAAMKAGIKTSWNWMAFLFPSAWFLSRKMYKPGILTGILSIAFSMLTIPFMNAVNYIDTSSARDYFELANLIAQNLPKIGVAALIAALIGSALSLLLSVIVGIRGDYSYKNYTISSIAKIKSESDDKDEDFKKHGGVNFFAMILGIMAVQYLPAIISMFAM